MTATATMLLKMASQAGLVFLAISMTLTIYRIVRGPKKADRIIALDLLSILVVALVALYAVVTGEESFLDVATAYALVAFLGTVALARYLERSAIIGRRNQAPKSSGEIHE